MNRSAISIAVATLAISASTGALADVTLYGKVDAGIVQESGGEGGSVTKLSSGVLLPSRLGVKTSVDVGDGLTAKAQLETGVCADSNNNPGAPYCTGGNFFGRRATLGLTGNFGELELGRQFTLGWLNIDNYDPFDTGLAGQSLNLFSGDGTRANNSIVYTSPTLSGFSAAGMYAFGEVNGDSKTGRQLGATASYNAGPLSIGAAYNQRTAADDSTFKDANLGISYDFQVIKAFGLVQRSTGSTQALVGATAPVAGGSLIASVVHFQDRSGAHKNASQYGIGYTHPLGKQLTVYAAYAHINNENGAAFTVGNATDDGSGNSAVNLGMVLSF